MGRPERPLDPEAGVLQRFAFDLRALREAAGRPSYRELAKRAHYSVTALSEAAGGDVLPSLAVTMAYVKACGGDPELWEKRWREVAAELTAAASPDGAGLRDAPYLGLVTYEPGDAHRFFGRSELVADLCASVGSQAFLAVFGPSGSGKSSLLRAGLLPALGKGALPGSADWPTSLITPGVRPVEELAISLASHKGIAATSLYADLMADPRGVRLIVRQILADRPGDTRILIIVDQFEEVYTHCRDERERTRFIDCLLAAARETDDRARVVIGVRADFYGRCAEHPGLVEALRGAGRLIGPMDEAGLREVVTGPASAAGLKVERAFVEAVIAEAGGEPGALPLVSHALLETWKRRSGSTLTLAGYRDAGGIQGAIAQTAERVYADLDPEQRELARHVFLRLTALGEGTEDTRRRVALSELLDDGRAVQPLLARLTAARLVTVDTDTVQVAHEALIRSWPRLRGWLAEDRELLRAHRRLTEDAAEWRDHGFDETLLYRGPRLAAWQGRDRDRLNDLEREFLTAARAREERVRAASRRRTRLTLAGLVAAVVVTTILATVSLVSAGKLRTERDLATSRQLAANARAQLSLDPELSLLLAKRAWEASPTSEAEGALRQAVLDTRVRHTLRLGAVMVTGVSFSPDGRRMAATAGDGTVRVWQISGKGAPMGEPMVLRGHTRRAWTPVFSPDGGHLATASDDGTIRVWDLTTGTAMVLRGHRQAVFTVAFSPDGERLVSAGDDGTARVWDIAGNGAGTVLREGDVRTLGVAFSPDGERLAVSDGDGVIWIWDAHALGEPAVVLRGHDNSVEALAFSPDGERVATASTDGTVRVWDADGRGDPMVLRGHDGTVENVAFSPDGHTLASVGNDGTVRLWGVGSAVDPQILRGHRGTVWGVAFSPDGRTLITGADDGTVRLWDTVGLREPVVLRGHRGPVWAATFVSGGHQVVSTGSDGTIRVWDWSEGGEPVVMNGPKGEGYDVAVSPDGRWVAAAGSDGTIHIRSMTGAGEPVVLRGHKGIVWTVGFSPDSRRLVSAGNDGTVRIWNVDGSGEPTLLTGDGGLSRYAAFSPNGRWVAGAGMDGAIRVWDLRNGGAPRLLRGHNGVAWEPAFSPDSRRLASSGNDGTVRVWDLEGSAEPVVLRGHQGIVWAVAFSPDGRHVASSGNDNTVRVWSADGTGEPVVFRGHGASVEEIEFGPDGGTLVSGHDDGTVRVWRCAVCGPMPSVLRLADTLTRRELTPEEDNAFGG